jgi:phosphohistidine phosphatase
MKTLYLVRHAKATRDDPKLADRDRPLHERGLHDAAAMGKRMAKHRLERALLVSSPALRALTTAQLFADQLGRSRESIAIDERVYAASVEQLLAVIRGLSDEHDDLLLFGHNPEFSELAARLSGKTVDMPTCAVARMRFDARNWTDIGRHATERFTLDKPEH